MAKHTTLQQLQTAIEQLRDYSDQKNAEVAATALGAIEEVAGELPVSIQFGYSDGAYYLADGHTYSTVKALIDAHIPVVMYRLFSSDQRTDYVYYNSSMSSGVHKLHFYRPEYNYLYEFTVCSDDTFEFYSTRLSLNNHTHSTSAISDFAGKSIAGKTVAPTSAVTETAGTGAEIFNNYDERTYDADGGVLTGNIASGEYSHAEGYKTTARGPRAHAEGCLTKASGDSSHAEGTQTEATNLTTHAEGYMTRAYGMYAHSEGVETQASGGASHAEGRGTIARASCQHVQGKYNIEDTTKYLHIVGNGTDKNSRSNAHTISTDGTAWFAGDVKIGGTGQDDEAAKTLSTTEYVDELFHGVVSSTPITYSELKAKRDNSELVERCFYRITDYQTTTVQEATQSAGHQFDIIVQALSVNALDVEAKAIQHEGDEYFANSNLSGWRLWYVLDNDTNTFAWADAEAGKGVIYRMVDEWGNDCPYDFKNIMMQDALDSENTTYYYTFDTNNADLSLDGSQCYNNVIQKYIDGTQRINRIIFITEQHKSVFNNQFDVKCYNNTLGGFTDDLKFGRESYGNKFTYGNHLCTFGTKFRNNIVGSECQSMQVGQGASNNVFTGCVYYSTFGNYFKNNVLPRYLYYSSFGHYVQNCVLGASAENPGHHMRFLTFENNVQYTNLYKADTTTNTYMENIKICSGTVGDSANSIMIEVLELAQKYAITYAYNSDGELKKYCEADNILTDDVKQELVEAVITALPTAEEVGF